MSTKPIIPPKIEELQQLGRNLSDLAIKSSQTTPRFVLSISGEARSHIVNYAKSRAAIRSLDPELPGGTMFYLYMEYHPGAITGGGFRVNLHFNTPENCDEALAFGASADGKGGFFLFPPVSDVSRLAVFVFTHRDFAGCPHMSSGVGGRLGVGRTCRSTIPLTHGKKTPKGSE